MSTKDQCDADDYPREAKRSRYHTNKKKSLEEAFKELNRECVKIKRKDRKCNNVILYSVLGELLKIMQNQNELFRNMKPELEYLGSYFDGLRVGDPTEFDLNLILKLPINYNNIFLDSSKTAYDCTNIFMHSEFRRLCKIPAMAKNGYHETQMWCDKTFRLSVQKFRSWMQKVVDSAMGTLPVVNNRRLICVKNKPYLLATKMSGPANTITIYTGNRDDNLIDVDLVPTFSFDLKKKPYNTKVIFDHMLSDKKLEKKYFVVPKPSDDEYSWRVAFPFQERILIHNKNNLKSAAKLLKLLRDVQDFKLLASYYIKTVFLWEVKNQHDNFWKRNSMSFLFLHMLGKLRDCLAKGEIKNFWSPEANLLKNKIKIETCRNWSNRLSHIIRTIEQQGRDNPEIIFDFFTKRK